LSDTSVTILNPVSLQRYKKTLSLIRKFKDSDGVVNYVQ
jgi:hypothetical protein